MLRRTEPAIFGGCRAGTTGPRDCQLGKKSHSRCCDSLVVNDVFTELCDGAVSRTGCETAASKAPTQVNSSMIFAPFALRQRKEALIYIFINGDSTER